MNEASKMQAKKFWKKISWSPFPQNRFVDMFGQNDRYDLLGP